PFFDGNDLTVAVIGNGGSYLVSPVAFVNYPGLVYSDQVKSKEHFYESLDFSLNSSLSEEVTDLSQKIANSIGVKGYARLDFKMNKNQPEFLEINCTPGFSNIYSTLPLLYQKMNIGYSELISRIIKLALEDYEINKRYLYGKEQMK
ncbi:D-alanine--D-alanine ligase, partial [Leptospira sp. 96542]|nr:D-alanine--D-alanine ligase [Leptospira sp. 96542]